MKRYGFITTVRLYRKEQEYVSTTRPRRSQALEYRIYPVIILLVGMVLGALPPIAYHLIVTRHAFPPTVPTAASPWDSRPCAQHPSSTTCDGFFPAAPGDLLAISPHFTVRVLARWKPSVSTVGKAMCVGFSPKSVHNHMRSCSHQICAGQYKSDG
jgi:hypothetical protein